MEVLFVLGVAVTCLIRRQKPIGTLRMDESDPEYGPYLFLELETDPSVIKRMNRVTLKVNVKNYISQK